MKTITMLLNLWDQAEAIRVAATCDREAWDGILREQCIVLREHLGFKEADPVVQETWLDIERSRSVREVTEWLHALEQCGITFADLSVVLAHGGKFSFEEMLAMMKGKTPNAQN